MEWAAETRLRLRASAMMLAASVCAGPEWRSIVANVKAIPPMLAPLFDLPLVRDVVMLLAAAVVLVNFVVDLLYALVDPRLRAH